MIANESLYQDPLLLILLLKRFNERSFKTRRYLRDIFLLKEDRFPMGTLDNESKLPH